MMGKTTKTAKTNAFYTKESAAWTQYKLEMKEMKAYTEAYEAIRTENDRPPSGHQAGDQLQALVEEIRRRSDRSKPKPAKREAGKSRSPNADENEGNTNTKEGGADDNAGMTLPMPENWLSIFFLTWIFFGPLSSSPDVDLNHEASNGPADRGSDSWLSAASALDTRESVHLLAEPGEELSAAQLKQLGREAKIEERKEKENGRIVGCLSRTMEESAKVASVLERLATAAVKGTATETRKEELSNLREQDAMARQDDGVELVRALGTKRLKLLQTPPVVSTIPAIASLSGGGNDTSKGSATPRSSAGDKGKRSEDIKSSKNGRIGAGSAGRLSGEERREEDCSRGTGGGSGAGECNTGVEVVNLAYFQPDEDDVIDVEVA